MKCCPSCARHLRMAEVHCPFCRASMREVGTPVAAVLGLAGLLAGCSDDGLTPEGAGSGGANVTTAASASAGEDDGGDPGATSMGPANPASTSSMGTTSLDDGATVGDLESGGGFIYGAPDAGSGLECDIIDDDCPRGEKCTAWANDGSEVWNATRCVPVARNPVGPGEPCTVEGSPVSGIDDCDLGSLCFHVDPETDQGTCVSFCEALEPPTCADDTLTCVVANEGVLPLCVQGCDPELPECPEGLTCQEIAGEDVCA